MFKLVVLVDELHIKCLGKVLAQEVRGSALQSLAILHHGLDGIGFECASKALICSLHALHYRQCHVFLGKISIHIKHLNGLGLCLLAGGMSGVTFLP